MRPPPTFSAIFARSTPKARARLPSCRCRITGSAKPSTTGCAAPRWSGNEETRKKSKRKQENEMNIVQPAAPPLSPDLIARFRAIVGAKYAVTDAADIAPYLTEERNLFHGRSPLVLRPGSTSEVSAICKLATEHRIALVPQGGNTGLVRGPTPPNVAGGISLRRLDPLRDV